MAEYKMVRLGDVCEIQSGGTPSRSKTEYWKDGTIPWVKIGDFSGKYLDKTTEHITQQGLDNSSAKLFSKGTILYSIFATLGEATILNIDATTNQAIAGIKIKDKSSVDIDYFYSFLKSLKDEVNRIGRGVAQNNINLSILKSFFIPLPPLETQKQIAAQLDKCTAVIAKHKQMLEKYDTLIKSRFIEMFGDPKINSSNLPTKKFIEVVKLQRGFDLPVQERNQDGLFNVYGSNGPLDKHDSFKVKAPGIVTGRSGTLGNVYYVLEDYWPLNTTLFSVDIHNNNVVYLKYLLELYDLSRFSEGAGVPTLNRNIVHDKDIIDVPLSLQNDFAAFVQQIDKSKFAVQKSLEKAETLYKSLMQLYFA
ncbi:restriction endonuclease subunit S [Treponema berlinense]|uniref:restriction endonuclease subunit S n=1 Tax=Treponema berlinense TaxID=225004 RepID=UPI003F11043A